jgi:hypothetical protein
MKVVIETGSESHTTSSARLQARVVGGGAADGKYLYEMKNLIAKTEFVKVQGGQWPVTEYNLPVGFRFIVEGHGRTGSRGSKRNDFKRLYEVGDENAPVASIEINVGLRVCDLKGRLIEIENLLEKEKVAAKITDEGF